MKILLWVIFCYLLGSVPCSLILAKAFAGIDIRYRGSGNVGATNVMRTAGLKIALVALAADILKGVIAAALSVYWFYDSPLVIAAASLSVVLGHCYSIFLGFKGGKGVASSAGLILYFMPQVVLVLAVIFTIVLVIWRYVSLSVLVTTVAFPFVVLFLGEPRYLFILSLLMALLVFYRHRENIERLRQGTESKIGEKA